jgi:KipI family sensor histidine kinase inhibitor
MRTVTVTSFGENADLVELPAHISPAAAMTVLADAYPALSIRCGAASVLLTGTGRPTGHDIVHRLAVIASVPPRQFTAPAIVIPVIYDGDDLERIAAHLSLPVDSVIEAHQEVTWRVAFLGFVPGFPYLVPSTNTAASALFDDLPRLDTPRVKVPPGAVAVAAGMSAVYPFAMPGGWNLLGRTSSVLFDPVRESPSLLHVDDLVQFSLALP